MLMEPEGFIDTVTEGGQGSWHSWSLLLSRRLVWEKSQNCWPASRSGLDYPTGLARSPESHLPPAHAWRPEVTEARGVPRGAQLGSPKHAVCQGPTLSLPARSFSLLWVLRSRADAAPSHSS